MKKLRRSESDTVLFGIIGGLGEYFNIDPVLLRVIFVFFVLVTGILPGVIAYFLALLIIPHANAPVVHEVHQDTSDSETPKS